MNNTFFCSKFFSSGQIFSLKHVVVSSFVHNAAPLICRHGLGNILIYLEQNAKSVLSYFKNKNIKLVTEEFYLLISGCNHEQM